jgi:hypothetical protein
MGIASINVNNSMGANGCVYINDTVAHAGDFIAVQFTEPSVIDAITSVMDNSAGLIADTTSFGAGQVIYVPFTSITLTSGAAILYKA